MLGTEQKLPAAPHTLPVNLPGASSLLVRPWDPEGMSLIKRSTCSVALVGLDNAGKSLLCTHLRPYTADDVGTITVDPTDGCVTGGQEHARASAAPAASLNLLVPPPTTPQGAHGGV